MHANELPEQQRVAEAAGDGSATGTPLAGPTAACEATRPPGGAAERAMVTSLSKWEAHKHLDRFGHLDGPTIPEAVVDACGARGAAARPAEAAEAADGARGGEPPQMVTTHPVWEAASHATLFDHLDGRSRRATAEDARSSGGLLFQLYAVLSDGAEVRISEAQARQELPLHAHDGEPAWTCKGCHTRGWSQAHTLVCVRCLAKAPMDTAELEERKHALRKHGCAAHRLLHPTFPLASTILQWHIRIARMHTSFHTTATPTHKDHLCSAPHTDSHHRADCNCKHHCMFALPSQDQTRASAQRPANVGASSTSPL